MNGASAAEPDVLAALVASAPRPWLIASDIDGTLAEITSRPAQSRLVDGALGALERLHALPGVSVAVVSGRSMAELEEQFALPEHLHLVGSHGVEFSGSELRTAVEVERLDALQRALADIAANAPGATIEVKPFSVALHVRGADVEVGAAALQAAAVAVAGVPGVEPHPGKRVLEVAVRRSTKAAALERLRALISPATVVFIGDDESDETGFDALLRQRTAGCVGHVVTVKVGSGPTRAEHRLAGPADVARFLVALVDRGAPTNR